MNIRVNVCTRNPVSCSIKPRYQHRSDGTSRAFCSPIACSNVRLILFRSKRTDRIECRRFINIRHPNPLTRGFGFKNNKVIFLIDHFAIIIDKRNPSLSIGKIITITTRNIFELVPSMYVHSLELDGKGNNKERIIDNNVSINLFNCIYTIRANLDLDRWSLPIIGYQSTHVIRRNESRWKRRIPSYLAPVVARTPRYSLSFSSFVFARGSSGAPIESTPVTRSNGGCRNNSSMSIYVIRRTVGSNESGTNYRNNEGKKSIPSRLTSFKYWSLHLLSIAGDDRVYCYYYYRGKEKEKNRLWSKYNYFLTSRMMRKSRFRFLRKLEDKRCIYIYYKMDGE